MSMSSLRGLDKLFAIADDWSWLHAGAYGTKWVNTPAFDRVAQYVEFPGVRR